VGARPVAITLRFDDDDGDDAGAAFAFGHYLQHYRKGEMAEPWSAWPSCTAWSDHCP
jgi:hypothetical protein